MQLMRDCLELFLGVQIRYGCAKGNDNLLICYCSNPGQIIWVCVKNHCGYHIYIAELVFRYFDCCLWRTSNSLKISLFFLLLFFFGICGEELGASCLMMVVVLAVFY